MSMDNFLNVNLPEVEKAVDASDVLVVGFVLFPERLLIDARSTRGEPSFVRVVQPVGGVEERLAELRALRPQFDDPERFFFFIWPRRITSFQEMGVWSRILDRVQAAEHPEVAAQCAAALRDLMRLEDRAIVRALTGEGYRTLWQRPRE